MRFFIIDEDDVHRTIVADIIEHEDLGIVVGEAIDGAEVSLPLLEKLCIDILLMDIQIGNKCSIDLLRDFDQKFIGEIIIISSVADKNVIGDAYFHGIYNYIVKPINRFEIISVIKQATKKLYMEKTLTQVRATVSNFQWGEHTQFNALSTTDLSFQSMKSTAHCIFVDLGITDEVVTTDLISIFNEINKSEQSGNLQQNSLSKVLENAVIQRFGIEIDSDEKLLKHRKSLEQRIRRVIHQVLENTAAMGLIDFSGMKFERYASTLFEFTQVRTRMMILEGKSVSASSLTQVSTRRFVFGLYSLVKQELDLRKPIIR